ncbi:MAG: N-acetylmuramoyl-L-alanine amidase [Leptolyngbyaceae cyanobacterium bins.302]|nr:N-acetylmuramoyl-L-alanine amidase [Leptolyngbyaceae cyanobacterium bins.302]
MKRFPSLWIAIRRDRRSGYWLILPFLCALLLVASNPVAAQQRLFIAYPPPQHETTSSKIFLIGTAPKGGTVTVNGQTIDRNAAGHFAPSFPLTVGVNPFTVRYGNQELRFTVTRTSTTPTFPPGANFAADSLTPAVNIGRQPNEWFCFGATATPGASVTVRLGNSQAIPLTPQAQFVELPPNSAVLTQQNQPTALPTSGFYRGCTRTVLIGNLGQPIFELNIGDQRRQQTAPGSVQILAPSQLEVAEVTADSGTARTGPGTDYSRLTPLPKGTQASITGFEGDWVRLDYGAWIRRNEVQIRKTAVPPSSLIRSVKARRAGDWTEIVFPLQVPVPVTVRQSDRTFSLTLHNTTAQTDTIRLDDDPLISRLDWYQPQPGQVEYVFNLKTNQQWGYKLRYEGTSLILSLRHPPAISTKGRIPANPLAGMKVVLDPGHGGPEDLGSRGPTGRPEKEVALTISKLVRQELVNRGATVVMTREQDVDLGLKERMAAIAKAQPNIALSLHYNALPDDGDALKTKGVSMFWYHPQAHSLAVYLHNYLVNSLKRPSYGVFWNNLALTRPTVAPSVLLELGFMINPDEYEWIANSKEQQRLANAIADGVTQWFYSRRGSV